MIVVPGSWQLQGYGKLIYSNVNYPFQKDEPKIEIVGDIFKVNGKATKLKGVNRHDYHSRTGFFVDLYLSVKRD